MRTPCFLLPLDFPHAGRADPRRCGTGLDPHTLTVAYLRAVVKKSY